MTIILLYWAFVTLQLNLNSVLSGENKEHTFLGSSENLTSHAACLNFHEIRSTSFNISVQVSTNLTIGSGTITGRAESTYFVLTSKHVLQGTTPPYTVQTSDGYRYSADVISNSNLENMDVVFLVFASPLIYYTFAEFIAANNIGLGDKVYAAGFLLYPSRHESSQLSSYLENQFVVREGNISRVLDRPLENGYRLAYTSSVDLGMSGGPILNCNGQMVGINSLRDDPIWEMPMRYEDGTLPDEQTQSLIGRSSLAILVEELMYALSQ